MKRILTFIAFLSLLASFGNEGWLKLYKLRQFEKALDGDNHRLEAHNEDLRREIQRLKDPKYLEHYIRQQIGWVRADEILYEFVDGTRKK